MRDCGSQLPDRGGPEIYLRVSMCDFRARDCTTGSITVNMYLCVHLCSCVCALRKHAHVWRTVVQSGATIRGKVMCSCVYVCVCAFRKHAHVWRTNVQSGATMRGRVTVTRQSDLRLEL